MNDMSSSKRSWVGVIFGMVFFCAGMAVAYNTALRTVITYVSSADWDLVPATIENLELKNHHGSDATTYSVRGRYNYYYQGYDYSSTRISFSNGSDNFGDYWHDLYARLNQDRRYENVMAWVNPDAPHEAVLDRTLRWASIGFGAVFAIMFGGIGGLVAWASWRNEPTSVRRPVLDVGKGIASKEKTGGLGLLVLGGIFFGVGSIMASMILPRELERDNYPALLILVFVLVGVGIMWAAVKQLLAYRRFGPTPLYLDPSEPGVGGEFGAWFVLASNHQNQHVYERAQFNATLCCLRHYKSGDDSKTDILWKEFAPVFTSLSSGGTKAACKLDVPADCAPSSERSNGDSIEWELSIDGDLSEHGLGKFSRSWEVFLDQFPSSQVSAISMPQAFLDNAELAAQKSASDSALRQISVDESGHGIDVISAAGRSIVSSIMGIVFGCIFVGMGVFTVGQDWWPGYLFIGIGALIALASLFSLGSAIDAHFDTQARKVRVRRSWLGVVFSSKEISLNDPSQFTVKRTSSTQSGSKSTEYYALYVRKNHSSDSKHKVAESIEGKEAVEALKAMLVEKLF
ncbi:hypothetical protein NBRC116583_06780 [Arenicella sp. 4NH20-0111]